MSNNNSTLNLPPAPAVRFRVVSGSTENATKRSEASQNSQNSQNQAIAIPQPQYYSQQQLQQQQPRLRFVRPLTERRVLIHRPQLDQHVIKSGEFFK